MNIRQATIEDSAGIAHVQVDSYRTAYAGIFPQAYLEHFTYEEQTQDWRDLLSAESADVLYVAETETGEIVGYALGRPGLSDIPPYDSELVALHVRRAYQRHGIGRRLIAAVAAHLKQKGCTSLMLWTLAQNPSRGLYERLGGQLLGEKDWGGNEDFGMTVQEVAYGWANIAQLATVEWMMTVVTRDNRLHIRPIASDELDAVLDVYRQCEDFLALGPTPVASMEMVLQDLEISRHEGGIFCGIYDTTDGTMIGVMDYVPRNFEGDPHQAFLSLLMIAAPFRQQGVGEAVVEAIEREIKKDAQVTAILSGVQVNNPQAMKFWQKRGYCIISGPMLMPDQTTVFGLRKDLD